MKKKLQALANHLLDLGKRNRLLNYKDNGLKSIAILNKNEEELFSNIVDSKTYTIFSLDSVLEKYHKDLILNPEKDSVLNYSNSKVYDVTSGLLKKNQLLCYKKGYSLEKVLKSLLREYKYSITEKGINCLYMSFGFIRYMEGNEEYVAPLLLIPMEFSMDKGVYKVKEYEDEIILNPTLKYYFKTVFGVNLKEYSDEGLNLYFDSISAILPKGSSFEDGCALGIYSFLKMNMYNDLMANLDVVLQNSNVKALLGDGSGLIEPLKEEPIYPVVNCDSSQLEAIGYAANGKSFVLQGPPGSGKSQTITNIISTLIANGKHVLFVSEKLAALNVVYENLRRAGLDDFAIELHSNKANKKQFIDNLYKTAVLPKYDIDTKVSNLESNHKDLKHNIKEYYKEIHEVIPQMECSLYELISMNLDISVPEMKYRLQNIESFGAKELKCIVEILQKYMHYSKQMEYDYRNSPFYGLKSLSNDYIRYELTDDFKSAIANAQRLQDIKDRLNSRLKLNMIGISDVYQSLELVETLVHLKGYEAFYMIKEDRDTVIDAITQYKQYKSALNPNIMKVYRESIIKEDLEDLYIRYKQNCSGFFKFLNSEYKAIHKRILAYRSSKAKPKQILIELEELMEYKKNLLNLRLQQRIIKGYFTETPDLDIVLKDLSQIQYDKDLVLSKESYVELKPYLTDILISFDSIRRGNDSITKISTLFDSSVFDIIHASITSVVQKLKEIYVKRNDALQYNLVLDIIKQLNEYQQLDYLHSFLKAGNDIDTLALQYKKLFLTAKIYQRIDSSIVLNGFASYTEDKIVEDFKELDEKILNVHRDHIISACSKKRPDDILLEGSKFKVLITEQNKLKRQKPIRALLDEIFELAIDIKPIFLMSPLSVSTYLQNESNLFDCVIFDEASQIFAWDSLGAIYRAKQCIIIGDTKQMPPSNFFGATLEDEEDPIELESILDVASLCFLTSRLKWHYRSRSEELITFSNQKFYDSNLITIPQASLHKKGFGIDYYYLSNGRYDLTTRTNEIEANHICDMVFEHFRTTNQSLGVVAFSDIQARKIEDLIEQRLLREPEYQRFFSEDMDEPFFVKNLESVQGDERDRIIFSICYGYNENNKFYQRFGPLNALGGERRLNVAITRAKYNISVVSSIRYTDIKLNNTESLGVKMLRDYLEFIEGIETKKFYSNEIDGIALDVKRYLEELGYTVYPNYGSSAFKIDLAVMRDNQFILAIMLDKRTRFSSNTTDRYRLEPLLLNRLGWKYYKLYCVSWFNHTQMEKTRLKDVLQSSEIIEKKEETIEGESFLCEDEKKHGLEESFSSYEEYSLEQAKMEYKEQGLEFVLEKLIRIEQPIHEEYLNKKISLITGSRLTNTLKNSIAKALPIDVNKNKGFYSLYSTSDTRLRIGSNRTIEQISTEELKNGIYTIVSMNNGITIEGCYRALIQVLGFNRVTENTKKLLDDVVIYLKLEGSITERGNSLFI